MVFVALRRDVSRVKKLFCDASTLVIEVVYCQALLEGSKFYSLSSLVVLKPSYVCLQLVCSNNTVLGIINKKQLNLPSFIWRIEKPKDNISPPYLSPHPTMSIKPAKYIMQLDLFCNYLINIRGFLEGLLTDLCNFYT